ncbi:GNAT family N-acetyltransferase [Bauldia sp.]|uniref:GNAT family N-acetyltransferase n=1 Tax=Bauldia sp. TaxID=2575872 RepID=UPI003BA998ED
MDGLAIRPATLDDVRMMADWAAAEGWNPGHDDHHAFYGADPNGFLVGWQGDEPISCISAVTYDDTYAFLGFYICRPEFRGRNAGFRLWQEGIQHVGDRTIGLDGVVDQQPKYKRSGFVLSERNIRFTGVLDTTPSGASEIRELTGPTPDLVAYDRGLVPAERSRFLAHWINPDHRRALVWHDDGAIRGYGVIRPCRVGYKIGPLFADRPEIADALLRDLVAPVGPAEVALDVPEPNANGLALVERYGMKPSFETARMYRGPAPTLPLDRVYGVTTFELG